MRPYLRIILIAAVALLLGRLVIVLALRPESRLWFSPDYWQQTAKLGEVLRIVNAHYVDGGKADFHTITNKALDGALQSLDRYSDFLDPEEFADFEVQADQHYAGIGVEIERLNRRVTVTDTFDGSPAKDAGVKAGDQIVAVGEEDTRDFGLREIVTLIRGPLESDIDVTFFRPTTDETFTRTLTRRDVEFPSLRDIELGPDKIGYLRLTGFGRRSGDELLAALDVLSEKGLRALVLDLRGNPGGLLPVSVEVAGAFLPEGSVVVSTKGRGGKDERKEYTQSPPRAAEIPLAVLVDSNSASASEIVSGALQDTGRAVIIGEQTVGKGSVQSVIYMADKEAVKLTTALYYLPSGRTINEVGVTPDIVVEFTDAERLRLLGQRAYRDLSDAAFEAQFGVPKLPDRQRQTAEDVLRGVLAFEKGASRKPELPL